MRLDKLLSNLKYGTRSMIKKELKKGAVKVNGEIVKDPSIQVDPSMDRITFHNQEVFYREHVTLLLNKPKGYVSANRDKLYPTVFELIKEPYNRFDFKIAGRLDVDTEGLLLLSTSGDFIHSIISPNKDVFKKYYVEVNEGLDATMLLEDMEILDGNNQPYTPLERRVEQITDNSFYLWIKEGKFHQVKRMCKHFNREVTYLKRMAIGDIELPENLELGSYIEI